MSRLAFVFDPTRCTACQACRIACDTENLLPVSRGWRRVHTLNERRHPGVAVRHLSMACNHCDAPACLAACPTAAYSRDDSTGAVCLDETRCIGCRYCAWACPYGAPRYDAGAGVMSKCTFCAPRLADGLEPACVACCPTGALGIGPRDGVAAPAYPGVFRDSLGPALHIVEPRRAAPPVPTAPPSPVAAAPLADPPVAPRRATVVSEWPLAVFTLVAAALAALTAATALGRPPLLSWWAVAALGGGAMVLSALHLGRTARAWRAAANWRSSFLSLEVLGFSAFLALAVASLAWPAAPPVLGAAAALTGLATLVAIDRLYQVPLHRGVGLHSALTVLTGAFLLGVVVPLPALALPVALVKTALYASRAARRPPGLTGILRVSVRLGVGLAVPLLAAVGAVALPAGVVLAAALLGEAIDRLEFYAGYDPPSPEGEMRAAFARALARRA
ncbi:MAG: 4Fe-4S dicluster domain-containing protein [Acidobacteria bacterium]|nr:4Fe-4S dicluster domain-containing protein [Acidobacteriota bacterium]